MHSLETIIARNAYASGREAGHAIQDGKFEFAAAVSKALSVEPCAIHNGTVCPRTVAAQCGFDAGIVEG